MTIIIEKGKRKKYSINWILWNNRMCVWTYEAIFKSFKIVYYPVLTNYHYHIPLWRTKIFIFNNNKNHKLNYLVKPQSWSSTGASSGVIHTYIHAYTWAHKFDSFLGLRSHISLGLRGENLYISKLLLKNHLRRKLNSWIRRIPSISKRTED